jgi:hypothetical protein
VGSGVRTVSLLAINISPRDDGFRSILAPCRRIAQ